ncbi:MAG: hypothetical protein PF638_05620 [Candidatus Delongbacteria bacterium]|jgi:hypothetical protein|nr:hypothetical protein [Candidatus Delongbacteria bacterium]
MKRMISILLMVILAVFVSCAKNDKPNSTTDKVEVESHKIIAQGWGETEEKALQDAKDDALRQFGFKVIEKDGKPELIPAGKILRHTVLSASSEIIEKGEKWWDVEIEAQLTNI